MEGQVRHTIHEHPEWFNLPNKEVYNKCVNGIAKRIIGEIIAGTGPGNDTNRSGTWTALNSSEEDSGMSPGISGGEDATGVSSSSETYRSLPLGQPFQINNLIQHHISVSGEKIAPGGSLVFTRHNASQSAPDATSDWVADPALKA